MKEREEEAVTCREEEGGVGRGSVRGALAVTVRRHK